MMPEWVTDVRHQCARAGVPFFFKQWGGIQKKRTGRKLDGRTYDEMPSAPMTDGPAASLPPIVL
jgi:protein gp37